jgi:hypothetical protein
MPPQQADGLLDFVDERLGFSTHSAFLFLSFSLVVSAPVGGADHR